MWVNGTRTQNYTYNAANQNQATGWQYDAVGNLLRDTDQQYTYDALNRMTQAIPLATGSMLSSNTYNADGTLVAQIQGSTTTRYTQDVAAPLSQILSDASTGSAQAQRYIYGNPAERLFAQQGTRARTW